MIINDKSSFTNHSTGINHTFYFSNPLSIPSESLKDIVVMEVDCPEVKSELPTPPASDVGSPTSFSHCSSDSEPDSPMGEETKVHHPLHNQGL